MPHNVLYNYLDTASSFPIIASLKNVKCSKKNNAERIAYYLLDIQDGRGIDIDNAPSVYTLINHHISVYEVADSNPLSGPYHYTAEFKDESGKMYRLHVYFNDKDHVAIKPVFESINEEGQYVRVESQPCHKKFEALAKQHTQPILITLRQGIATQIQGLEVAYNRLEKEARVLSKDIAKNYELYMETLDKVYNVVQELLPFVGNRNFYVGISNWLQKLMVAVKRQHLKEQKSAADARIKSEAKEACVEKEEVVPPASTASEKNVDLTDTAAKEATRCEALLARFNSLSKQSDQTNAVQVPVIYADLRSLILEIESEKTTASLTSIAELDELHANLNTTAQDLYKRLLAGRNIDALKHLADFHFLLEDKHVSFALVMGDVNFLSFLLEYGNFDIHNITIGKNNSTAIRYCFDNVAKTGVVACFTVLVKKDISVLLKDVDGISIAHTILSDPNHPLRKALFVDIDRNQFIELYKTLIEELQNSVNEDPDNKKGKNPSLISAISKYQDELRGSSVLKSSADNTFFKSSQANIAKELGEKEIDVAKLENDPRIAEERKALLQSFELYFSKLSHQEKTQSLLRSKKRMTDLSAIVKVLPTGLSHELVVNTALRNLRDNREYINNCSQLHDVQKELKKSYVGNPSKKRRQQLKDQTDLMAKLKAYETKYIIDGNDSILGNAGEALTNLMEGMGKLQKIMQLLSKEKMQESTKELGSSADSSDESTLEASEFDKQLGQIGKDLESALNKTDDGSCKMQ